MKNTSVRLAVMLVQLLALSQCARGVEPEQLLAEAEVLRLQQNKRASEEALEKYRDAIAVLRSYKPREAARAAQGLGQTFQQLGLLTQSQRAFTEALTFAERSRDGLLEADVQGDVGFAEASIGDRAGSLDRAEALCQKALKVARALGGNREQAKALVCIGEVIYSRGGSFEPALSAQQEAEALWQRSGSQAGVAQARLAQGWLFSDMRRFEEAETVFDSARALWSKIGDKRGLAITLVADARLLERRGQYQESLQTYQRACALLALVGDAMWQGSCLAGQATIYQFLADNTRALDNFERALHVAEVSGQKVFAMDMLGALGNTLRAAGDDAAALSRFEQAFNVAVELANPRFQAWALTFAGGAHLSQRSAAAAKDAFERSLKLLPGLNERWIEAQALSGLGETFEQLGDRARAYEYFNRALGVSRRAEDRILVAKSLSSLGSLEARQGSFVRARADLDTALGDYQRLFGADHPLAAQTRTVLASVDFASGRLEPALSASVDAERTTLDHLRLTVRSLPERQALAFASKRPRGLDLAISAVAAGASREIVRVYDLVVQSRGVILDELVARSRVRIPSDARLATLHEAADRARQRYANLLVRSIDGSIPVAELDEARRRKEAAERTLAQSSVEARADLARVPTGLEAVRRALPAKSALVSFVQYSRSLKPVGTGDTLPVPAPAFAAFVLRPGDGGAALVPLRTASEIEQLIEDWRVDVAQPSADAIPAKRPARSHRISGARLREAIWDPLLRQLQGANRIFIVPDAAISLVPFAALPIGESGFLLEQAPPIHYLSAERDLVSAAARPTTRARGMLALGGPAFDAAERSAASKNANTNPAPSSDLSGALRFAARACESFQSLQFQPLDGALEEVRELSGVWKTAAPAEAEAALALVDRDASETAFKREAHSHRVLHLATHGFFLGSGCTPANPSTRGVGGLSGATPASVENPLLLSGLALAGANKRASAGPDEDDGILTAEEVASLNLEGVEWAVLSACDTGVGEIKAGEGVFGLRRAFQVAGARTVIMSLWSVDDQATRAWMRSLYEGRFQRQLSTADAVHAAALSVLRARRASGLSDSPFYWAAFVAVGDWR